MPKARLQLDSRKSPDADLPTCCCPSWAATSSCPAGPDSRTRLGGWRGRKRQQVPLAGCAAGSGCSIHPSPPRFPGPPRAIGRQRPGGGVRRAGIACTASKEPRILQSALEPWPARSLPGAGKLGLGNSGLLRLTQFYKPLDLTCLCTPHFHSMSPCSCASNR